MRVLLPAAVASALLFSASHASIAQERAPQPSPPSVQLPEELATVLRSYERAWSAKDVQAIARLFAADGMALPNGAPPVSGQAAIERLYAPVVGSPLFLRAISFGIDGSLAYVIGGFSPASGSADIGKFTLVLRCTAPGTWSIVSDMDNVNAVPRRSQPQQ